MVNIVPLLCKGTQCVAMDQGELVMADDNHLSLYGSTRVVANMQALLN